MRASYAAKQALHLWHESVKRLLSNECFLKDSNCIGPISGHHLIRRACLRFCYDPRNGVPLCTYHHTEDQHRAPHRNPKAFLEILKQRRPEQYAFYMENKDVQAGTVHLDYAVIRMGLEDLLVTLKLNEKNVEPIWQALFQWSEV